MSFHVAGAIVRWVILGQYHTLLWVCCNQGIEDGYAFALCMHDTISQVLGDHSTPLVAGR
jgi:hypothetical protein